MVNIFFKPTVLDEVDYALHYFQQVLFDAMPQLHRRLSSALSSSYPEVDVPQEAFMAVLKLNQ